MVELLIGNSALGTTNIIMSGQHLPTKNSRLTSTGNTHRVISVNTSRVPNWNALGKFIWRRIIFFATQRKPNILSSNSKLGLNKISVQSKDGGD